MNRPPLFRSAARYAAVGFLVMWATGGPSGRALAQAQSAPQGAPQIVESLDAHRARIENILRDRLEVLIPNKNYVLRVNVSGEPVTVPAAPAPGQVPELPGFRQMPSERRPGDPRQQVTRVDVKIVIGADVTPSELGYLRSIVPIIADFDTARGDTLDIQVISPKALAEQQAESQGAMAPLIPGMPPFSIQDWILIGLMALALLLLLIVMMRVSRAAKAPPAPMPMPAAPAPKPQDLSEADKAALKVQEEERVLDEVRKDVVKNLAGRPDLARQLVRDWQAQPKNLIALVQAFGSTVARQTILTQMDRAGYQALEDAVRTEKPVDRAKLTDVLREANLFLVTQELAQPEQIRPDPFTFLGTMSRGQIAHLVKDEPVRVKAIVLSRIAPEDMAHILESMPRDMQLEVAVQIGNFHSLPLDAVSDIARNLAEKARKVPDEKTVDIEGPKALVDLMTRASTGTIQYLLDAMKGKDRKLSEEVERRFFLFDSIPLVPDDVLPQVVRRLPSAVVIQAIQGTDPALQRKVIMAFPEQARTGLVTTLKGARFDAATVMEARQQVVARFQALASEGRINLKEISDAWQSQAKAS